MKTGGRAVRRGVYKEGVPRKVKTGKLRTGTTRGGRGRGGEGGAAKIESLLPPIPRKPKGPIHRVRDINGGYWGQIAQPRMQTVGTRPYSRPYGPGLMIRVEEYAERRKVEPMTDEELDRLWPFRGVSVMHETEVAGEMRRGSRVEDPPQSRMRLLVESAGRLVPLWEMAWSERAEARMVEMAKEVAARLPKRVVRVEDSTGCVVYRSR